MRLHCTKTSTPYKLPENTNKTQTRKNEFSLKLQFMSVFFKNSNEYIDKQIWHEKIEIKHVNKTIL